MTKRRHIFLWSLALAVILLVAGAIGLSDGTFNGTPPPTITASPYVKLQEPEPKITADSGAKMPSQPKPVITTKKAPAVTPVPAVPLVPAPVYQTPGTIQAPTYQQPSAPVYGPVPSVPLQPLPSPVPQPSVPLPEPVGGIVGPVIRPLDPVLKPLDPIIRHLPIIPKLLK